MNFLEREYWLGRLFLEQGQPVETKTWQALDVSDKPEMVPIEIPPTTLVFDMPQTRGDMGAQIKPNLPWAEDHFRERVSGKPLNPPPSHTSWPHARTSNAEHVDETGIFSHTYPERFWPKWAGEGDYEHRLPHKGIRYDYGDLDDVIKLLLKDPYTRQAYLPVFFPEDTGQKSGQRIPCTLGYQFMIRQGKMNIIYGIRSCDFLRHFRDDVYMAMRLAWWVTNELYRKNDDVSPVEPALELGKLYMNIGSFHVFQGDLSLMRLRYK